MTEQRRTVLIPIVAFVLAAAGFVGGGIIGVYAGRAMGSDGLGYLVSGVLMFVLTIAGYSYGSGIGKRG